MTDKQDKAVAEARARIIWGEPMDVVLLDLQRYGLSAKECRQSIAGALSERARAMRLRGVRDCIIGCLIGGIGIIGIVYLNDEAVVRTASRGAGVSIVALIAGVWLLLTGVDRLVSGAKATGSLAEL